MKKIVRFPLRVYVDTSVFGGVFDSEFEKASINFFNQVKLGYFKLVVSPLVADEIARAKEHIQFYFENLLQYSEKVIITDVALDLRDEYINAKIVTKKSYSDALHVALASTNNIPLIISWNFKHIVNYKKIQLYNAINLTKGYQTIGIHSPLEVLDHEE